MASSLNHEKRPHGEQRLQLFTHMVITQQAILFVFATVPPALAFSFIKQGQISHRVYDDRKRKRIHNFAIFLFFSRLYHKTINFSSTQQSESKRVNGGVFLSTLPVTKTKL